MNSLDRELINALKEVCQLGRELKEIRKEGLKVRQFPQNMYLPEGAKSIDMRNLFTVDPGATETLIDYTPSSGGVAVITHFGIFNDGLLASDFDFFPTVNGNRIYPFHGDPLENFRLYLGTAPDLSNDSLHHAPITLQPGQRLLWRVQNRAAVPTDMGVRVVGYFTRIQDRKQVPFGG